MSNEEFPRDSTNAILPVIAEDGSSELRRRHQRVSWLGSMQFSVAGEEACEGEGPEQQTYAERAMANGMAFTVTDVPPLGLSIILGVQHYLTMLGATVLIPLLICPEMGASPQQTAQVISTIFFVSGLNTLIQTSIGDRLPIVQGGSFSYLPATYGIIFNPELQAIEDDNERFLTTMQTIQGAIIVVGIIQMAIGYSGLFGKFLKFISPITIACVISAVGLGLYGVAFPGVADCFATGLLMIAMLVFFPLYMSNVKIYGLAVFRLFPVVLSIATTWIFAAILSAAGVWDEDDACSTAGSNDLIASAKWFYFPYPGQWGPPRFESYAIIPMIGSMLASSIESLGDYYACANIAGAPPPTPGIISRGVAGEGIGVVLAGLWGTGNGTTSYSENVGALSITGVGSRAVVQCGAVAMILVSVIAKVGAVLASMPTAMVSAIYCIVFGIITAIGLSNLQYVDLNIFRNLFIVGVAIFNSLAVAGPGGYFDTVDGNPFGTTNAAEIAYALFSSPMIIAFLIAFFLDNTVPGTREERGLAIWDKASKVDVNNDPEYVQVYSLPLCFARTFRNCDYLEYIALGRMPAPPAKGYKPGRGDIGDLCCPCLLTSPQEEDEDEEEEVGRSADPKETMTVDY